MASPSRSPELATSSNEAASDQRSPLAGGVSLFAELQAARDQAAPSGAPSGRASPSKKVVLDSPKGDRTESPKRNFSASPRRTTSGAMSPSKILTSAASELQRKAKNVRAGFTRPRWWVLLFGWTLAMIAGTVNVVAFRHWGTYVSHMTGDTTAIGMRIEGVHQRDTEFGHLGSAVAILVSFWLGAFTCGLLIDKNSVHFGGKSFYGFALVCNGLLLVASTFIQTHIVAACFAAGACGLQNAMCTSHFGAVVRTTHVTGTVTDIGSTLGRIAMIYLRKATKRRKLNVVEKAEVYVDARKLLVLLPMWTSFLLGTILGAYLYTLMQIDAMLLPACFTLCVGLFYMFFRQRLKGYLKQLEHERLNRDMEKVRCTLERAQFALREAKEVRRSHSNLGNDAADDESESIVIELEEGFEDMLERMRDLEENIGMYCASPRSSLSGHTHGDGRNHHSESSAHAAV